MPTIDAGGNVFTRIGGVGWKTAVPAESMVSKLR
jgi:hypothetical protein